MSRIFLTKQFEEGPTKYFAIDDSKIETLKVSDTYDQYGQKINHYDAEDYSIENSSCDAKTDCEKAIEEKFGIKNAYIEDEQIKSFDDVDADDYNNYSEDNDEYNKTLDLIIDINQFIDEWRKENETFTEVKGFTYWDGHNWKTITVEHDHYETTHKIVTVETLIAELNKAIEEKEFEGDGFGCKIYKGNSYVVVDSFWQGTWAEYEIISEEDYEFEQQEKNAFYPNA